MITNISLACENNCCLYYKPTDDRNHCRKSGSGTFNCRSRTLSSASVHFSPCHFTCITSCITATEICDTESTQSANHTGNRVFNSWKDKYTTQRTREYFRIPFSFKLYAHIKNQFSFTMTFFGSASSQKMGSLPLPFSASGAPHMVQGLHFVTVTVTSRALYSHVRSL